MAASSRQPLQGAASDAAEVSKICQIEAVQESILKRLKESKRLLERFNSASGSRVDAACREMQISCELLGLIKADLDYIYKRTRALKEKLANHFPEPETL